MFSWVAAELKPSQHKNSNLELTPPQVCNFLKENLTL